MEDEKSPLILPEFPPSDGACRDACVQTLLLDFQLTPDGECSLTTKSRVPLRHPRCVVAAFNNSAFDVPGGIEARVDLLYALENDFADWEEHRPPIASLGTNSKSPAFEASWIVTVTNLDSAQLHRAIALFIELAAALVRLARRNSMMATREPNIPDA
jgi:hypothetical protein